MPSMNSSMLKRERNERMEKLLPQNLEAECGVLGSIIIDPDAIDRVIGIVQAGDFYRDAHRTIYEAVLTLSSQGRSADFITICDELERRNKLENVGGASYITSLINQVPTSGNVEYYGRIVERTSVLRRLISAAGRIAAVAYDEVEVAAALELAEHEIFEISSRYLLAQSGDIGMSELMAQYMRLIDERYEHRGKIVGVPTGFADLDRLLGGLQSSDLDILAARPGIGKTTCAINIAYNAALKFGRQVGIFSLEMSKEQLAQKFVALDSSVEQQRLRTGRIEDEDWPNLIAAIGRLADLGIRIDDTAGITLVQMRSRARRWVAEYGIELIIVDYLQLVGSDTTRKYENRQVEVSALSKGLKTLARELHIPVPALAQLSRAVEGRQSKVPQLSDLRESGSIENEADVVMFIYRDEVYNPESERKNQADIIVAKHRNGPIGEVALYCNQAQSRFGNLDVALMEDGEELVFAVEEEMSGEREQGFPPDEDEEDWEKEEAQDEE